MTKTTSPIMTKLITEDHVMNFVKFSQPLRASFMALCFFIVSSFAIGFKVFYDENEKFSLRKNENMRNLIQYSFK